MHMKSTTSMPFFIVPRSWSKQTRSNLNQYSALMAVLRGEVVVYHDIATMEAHEVAGVLFATSRTLLFVVLGQAPAQAVMPVLLVVQEKNSLHGDLPVTGLEPSR